LNQGPDLAERDRECGKVEPAAVDYVSEQAEAAVRGPFDCPSPAVYLLVALCTRRAYPQNLGRDCRVNDVQVFT
jgi:hypothetical protein